MRVLGSFGERGHQVHESLLGIAATSNSLADAPARSNSHHSTRNFNIRRNRLILSDLGRFRDSLFASGSQHDKDPPEKCSPRRSASCFDNSGLSEVPFRATGVPIAKIDTILSGKFAINGCITAFEPDLVAKLPCSGWGLATRAKRLFKNLQILQSLFGQQHDFPALHRGGP